MKKVKNTKNVNIVDLVTEKDFSLFRYIGAIPNIMFFQIVIRILLTIVVSILTFTIQKIVSDSGVMAITNMDFPYLFRSVKGIIILIIGFSILCLYTIFDLNSMILICDNVLHRKDYSLRHIIKEALISFKYMIHPKGLFMLLFVVIIAPLTISFYGISLTESFYIPDFIFSVIRSKYIYFIPYSIFIMFMAIFAFFYVFSFQFMILRRENISKAMTDSRMTIQKHWKNFTKRYGLFLLKYVLIILVIASIFGIIPLLYLTITPPAHQRFWMILCSIILMLVVWMTRLLFTPFQIMELNRIYESYTVEDEGEFITPRHSWHLRFWFINILVIAAITGLAFLLSEDDELFDYFFPLNTPSEIIAHRAGGSMANENTILGLEESIKRGVYGAEIDIQRTKDGHYIVYHDDRMDRLCDVDVTPNELTLEECKKLKVKNTFDIMGKPTELATYEEMLDHSKGRIHLYIELKGATADLQMVEDAYQMIKERDMVDDVTVISLKYDLICAMEEKHPEINTGICALFL